MKKIAILVANYFEDNELFYPYFRLQEEGFVVDLVGVEKDQTYKSKHEQRAKTNVAIADVKADEYDAVVIPGGYSPDHMRRSKDMIEFVKAMNDQNKPIAAICHGPWMMASCCDLTGKNITAFFSIKDDLINAGANYVDQEVVVDGNLITSRTPKDLPIFVTTIINALK